jgi:hypothetical protein
MMVNLRQTLETKVCKKWGADGGRIDRTLRAMYIKKV